MWKIGIGLTVGFFVARYLYVHDLVGPQIEEAIKHREQTIRQKLGGLLNAYQLPKEEVEQSVKEVMDNP